MGIITMREMLAELLISEVKSKRILWDMKHKSYHNRLLVDREWSKIAGNVRETNK
jgi:deoxyxylulose-5-phosphate synthase